MNCSWERNRTAMLSLAAIFLLGAAATGRADDGIAADNDAVDMLLLGDFGPIFVRWRLLRDGNSFRVVWHDFADAMFRRLDVDGDGVLRGREWNRMPDRHAMQTGDLRALEGASNHVNAFVDMVSKNGSKSRRRRIAARISRNDNAIRQARRRP